MILFTLYFPPSTCYNAAVKQYVPKEVNLIGLGITVLALVVLSLIVDIGELKALVENAGPWVPLAFIALKISTIVIAPLSGGPLYPLSGLLFGFWPGLAVVAIGDFLGYTIAFCISRYLGRRFTERFIAQKEGSLLGEIVKKVETAKGFALVALTFLPMPELLSYGAGLTKLRYPVFISILWPMWTVVATILVLIGSYFDLSDKPILLALGIPALAGGTLLIGGFFLSRDLPINQLWQNLDKK